MNKPTLGLCMIVKATDEEAFVLQRALRYTHEHVDKIFITITGENEKCEEIAKSYNAHISHFDWVGDFAAARNFNFSQADTDYIIWIDADDVIKGAEKLSPLMERIGTGGNAVDMVLMNYLYDFDDNRICTVKHVKGRIIKNDGCVEWAGAVHEDFAKQRELYILMNEEIEIMHLSSSDRFAVNKERNYEIAKRLYDENPTDPRNLWLIANACIGMEDHEMALRYLEGFIAMTGSHTESYTAYLRIASIYRDNKQFKESLQSASQAQLIRPWFPDAYLSLGETCYFMGKMEHAEQYLREGIRIAAEDDRYKTGLVVYNPRDYDVNALNLLSRVYFNMERPREAKACIETILKITPYNLELKKIISVIDEKIEQIEKVEKFLMEAQGMDKKKLKKAFGKLPEDVRSHPGVCNLYNKNFIKEKSSGRDLVIFCSYTNEVWNPDTLEEKGIGGSEEAVINLAPQLAKLGWNVTVYANMGHKQKKWDGVTWKPYWSWNFRDKQDVTIIWRHLKPLDFDINSDKIFIDLHDVINTPYEFSPERQERITKIMVKTEAHKYIIQSKSKVDIPDEKFAVIPNGLRAEEFDKRAKRDPYLLLNTSSPDRSLQELITLYERVLERVSPEIRKKVKLAWFYGWGVFDTAHGDNKQMVQWKKEVVDKFDGLIQREVATGGHRVSQVHEWYLKAGAFVYPTIFYEIHCISAAKAQAAGCYPITTNFAALDETVQYGIKIDSMEPKDLLEAGVSFGLRNKEAQDKWVDAVVKYLENPDVDREAMSKWAKETYSWDSVAAAWHKQLL